jgi:hypothetical protein
MEFIGELYECEARTPFRRALGLFEHVIPGQPVRAEPGIFGFSAARMRTMIRCPRIVLE